MMDVYTLATSFKSQDHFLPHLNILTITEHEKVQLESENTLDERKTQEW